MVQEGGKKKKNKNKNKKNKQQAEGGSEQSVVETSPAPAAAAPTPAVPESSAPVVAKSETKVNGVTNTTYKDKVILNNLVAEASQWMNYNWSAIQEAEVRYQTYLAQNAKVISSFSVWFSCSLIHVHA